jgi:L-ascorbate metabolism protein UlaG (beta-lactamase superfamily)
MGPDDALRAVSLIAPKLVVPIHYNTFDVINQDPVEWAKRVENETSAKVKVLLAGKSVEL